jgi:SpoVK/Ycf46/Vps4 family AAA+-type ATPase
MSPSVPFFPHVSVFQVVVLGATNRPFDLDDAALRRFTHRVHCGLPAGAERADILRVVLAGEALDPGVDLPR